MDSMEVNTVEAEITDNLSNLPWQTLMRHAYRNMFKSHPLNELDLNGHSEGTPDRMVRMYEDIFWGASIDPVQTLMSSFEEKKYDEMIIETDIPFHSWCSHHLLPFFGVAHFGYIPNGKIVGLSKIPRTLDVLAARPQVQEKLTVEMAQLFYYTVKPFGCGVILEAKHMCVECRGVEKSNSNTITSRMLGNFKGGTKTEFIELIKTRRSQ